MTALELFDAFVTLQQALEESYPQRRVSIELHELTDDFLESELPSVFAEGGFRLSGRLSPELNLANLEHWGSNRVIPLCQLDFHTSNVCMVEVHLNR